MATYATVDDYEARYETLGDAEASRVSTLLDDVSVFIDALVESKGIDAVSSEHALMMLCRDYAHRVRENEKQGTLSSLSQQAGSFMEVKSFKRLKDDFDAFAVDYYAILGVSTASVCFAWPGDAS